jgi:Na+/glutamate symporter
LALLFAYGQIVVWGQYIVGICLVLVILDPVFSIQDIFGIVVPVGFERAIAEMGQSMGVTATGLLLLRAADPEQKNRCYIRIRI